MEKPRAPTTQTSRKKFPQKRMECLKKKLHELTIICGVDAFLIAIYDTDSSASPNIQTWPEDRNTLLSLIDKYKNCTKQEKKRKRTEEPSSITRKERTNKLKSMKTENQEHEMGKNPELDMGSLFYKITGHRSIEGLDVDELQEVRRKLESVKMKAKERVRLLKMQENLKEDEVERVVGAYQNHQVIGEKPATSSLKPSVIKIFGVEIEVGSCSKANSGERLEKTEKEVSIHHQSDSLSNLPV